MRCFGMFTGTGVRWAGVLRGADIFSSMLFILCWIYCIDDVIVCRLPKLLLSICLVVGLWREVSGASELFLRLNPSLCPGTADPVDLRRKLNYSTPLGVVMELDRLCSWTLLLASDSYGSCSFSNLLIFWETRYGLYYFLFGRRPRGIPVLFLTDTGTHIAICIRFASYSKVLVSWCCVPRCWIANLWPAL